MIEQSVSETFCAFKLKDRGECPEYSVSIQQFQYLRTRNLQQTTSGLCRPCASVLCLGVKYGQTAEAAKSQQRLAKTSLLKFFKILRISEKKSELGTETCKYLRRVTPTAVRDIAVRTAQLTEALIACDAMTVITGDHT
jgi:hypothetical protein